MKLKFSIIIPIYNAENYLEKSINSVLIQNIKEIEIILVNDGSRDRSLDICKKYEKNHSNIKIINQENKGQAVARNRGIKIAKGEYIIFLDSDDWLVEKCLETVNKLLAKEQYEILGIKANQRDAYGNLREKYTGIKVEKEVFSGKEYIAKNGIDWQPMVWLYIFSREYLISNNLYFLEGVFHEDSEFMVRAILKAKKIKISDIEFYNYYESPSSTMRSKNIKKCKDLIIIAENINNNIRSDDKNINNSIKRYSSFLAWESLASCIKQGIEVQHFLNRYRKRIIKNIQGKNKYIIIKILLILHLETIILRLWKPKSEF